MEFIVGPNESVGKNGGSFQECTLGSGMGIFSSRVSERHGRYCTIRDDEHAPPTSQPGRKWVQIYRTPDNTE
jgi:hypothetical protein